MALRQAGPNAEMPFVNLKAVGWQGELYWLVNGHLSQQANNRPLFNYRFLKHGEYRITAMDEAGHYDNIFVDVIE